MRASIVILIVLTLICTAACAIWAAVTYLDASNPNTQIIALGVAIAGAVVPYVFTRMFEDLNSHLPPK